MATRRVVAHVEEEESYFVSMTDVVIGLLFIFIIMLMFFAMRFQEATKRWDEATDKQSQSTQKMDDITKKQRELISDLTSTEKARSEILDNIASAFQRRGVTVFVIRDEG